jgi:hypothetical protein
MSNSTGEKVNNARVLALLALALAAPQASAECGQLLGTWQSDHERTMTFNRTYSKLEERQDRFLAAIIGHMTMEFSADELLLRMPDTQVTVGGEIKPFFGFEHNKPYKILHCDSRSVVIESPEPVTGENGVTTYFFVGHDEMWAYIGTNSTRVPDLHFREYFRRTR